MIKRCDACREVFSFSIFGGGRNKKYHTLALYSIIAIIFEICYANQCEPQYSAAKLDNNTALWQTISDRDLEIAFSIPLCLDSDEKIITRICIKGRWVPSEPPLCEYTQAVSKICPEPFKEQNGTCVVSTEPRTWHDGCSNIKSDSCCRAGNTSNFIWLYKKQTIKYDGYKYSTYFGKKYGLKGRTVDVIVSDSDDISKKCLIFDVEQKKIYPEYCHSLHTHICILESTTQMYMCPKDCIPAGLGLNKCYCKRYYHPVHLAKVRTYFDKITLQKFANEEDCLVEDGFHYDRRHFGLSFSFKRSQRTYLVSKDYMGPGDRGVSCYIEQRKPLELPEAKMVLGFDKHSRNLTLTLFNPRGVVKSGSSYGIFCFTDASIKSLTMRVITKFLFEHESNIPEEHYVVYNVQVLQNKGQYWCDGFYINFTLFHSNKVVAYRHREETREYALSLIIRNFCQHLQCFSKFDVGYRRFYETTMGQLAHALHGDLRIMEFLNINFQSDRGIILFHLTTLDNKYRDKSVEYDHLLRSLLRILPSQYMALNYLRSAEYCLPDIEHFRNFMLSWKKTKMYESSVPENVCLNSKQEPVVRVCKGNFFYGAQWSDSNSNCSIHENELGMTNTLNALSLQDTTTWNHLIEVLHILTHNSSSLNILDLYYISNIIENIRLNNAEIKFLKILTAIIDKINHLDRGFLERAQHLLNITDKYLKSYEMLGENTDQENSPVHFFRKSVTVYIFGLPQRCSSFYFDGRNESDLTDVKLHFTQNSLTKNNALMAVHIEEKFAKKVQRAYASFVVTLFENDKLFPDADYEAISKVLSITISKADLVFETPISIVFKANVKETVYCGFWQMGQMSEIQRGHWSTMGSKYLGPYQDSMEHHVCSFTHLSHFALIVKKLNRTEGDLESYEQDFLFAFHILTIIGGVLSAVGIIGIFLTAIVYKTWREKPGTKILISIAAAITLEGIGNFCLKFQVSPISCMAVNIVMHYIVLTKILWMLIYSILQYYRFVVVLGVTPHRIVKHCLISGWSSGVLWVLIWLIFAPSDYYGFDRSFCFIHGNALYFGLVLPSVLVILANLSIFMIIIFKVSLSNLKSESSPSLNISKLYLAILLFFVMGMPLCFEILGIFVNNETSSIIFLVLFALTGNIQGFVLFLFYVLMNEETRTRWIKIFSNLRTNIMLDYSAGSSRRSSRKL